MRTKLFLMLSLITLSMVRAQIVSVKYDTLDAARIAAIPYYDYGRALSITAVDSSFQFNSKIRLQNRVSYMKNDGEKSRMDGRIQEFRLGFDGYVFNPKFGYLLTIILASNEIGKAKEGKQVNNILDAMMYYRPNKRWSFGIGQLTPPGARQSLNSSSALSLTSRSINEISFKEVPDFGIHINQLNEFKDKFSYNFRASITTGEGYNALDGTDMGLAYTGRIELLPLGAFTKNGAFFEGDLKREPTPKLMIGAAYAQNNQATKTNGQSGNDLFASRTMKMLYLDIMLKYRGWSFVSAFMNRAAKDPITYNPKDDKDFRYVFVGRGFDLQTSYLFKSNWEVIGRYSNQKMDKKVKYIAPSTDQYTLGLTKYIKEHSLKIQSEVAYEDKKIHAAPTKSNWYLRFQVEIGI